MENSKINVSEKEVYNHIAKYAKHNSIKTTFDLITTAIIIHIGLFCPMYTVPITALFACRLFVIFHDIAHHAGYDNNLVSELIGKIAGTMVFTPYSFWKKGHDIHHKISNNLDKKQYSQSSPFTVEQYKNSSGKVKFIYRMIYSGFSLATITPALVFFVIHRFVGTIFEMILFWSYIYILYETKLLNMYLLIAYVASIYGVLLFHVQHTYDNPYRKRTENWSYFENGMLGSSYLKVPKILKYFTYGIEYHHIHHLNARVPGFRLRKCHEEAPEGMFDSVPRVYIKDIFKNLKYELYDEQNNKFISISSINKKTE